MRIGLLLLVWTLCGCERLHEFGNQLNQRFHSSRKGKLADDAETKASKSDQPILEYTDQAADAAVPSVELPAEPDTPTERGYAKGGLTIGTSEAIEGSQFFSLQFSCSVRESEDDYDSWGKCRVSDRSALQHVKLEPDMEFKVITGPDRIQLVGSFLPDQQYRVTFAKGLVSESGHRLLMDVKRTVRVPSYSKSLRFSTKARYLPKIGSPQIEFEARNIADAQLLLERIHPQNIVYWLTKNSEASSEDIGEEVSRKRIKIKSNKNRKFQNSLAIDELSNLGPGVYSLSAWTGEPGKSAVLDRSTFVYTDIAAVVKQDHDKIRVWTRSIKNLAARGGVDVRVLNMANRELAHCTTSGTDSSCELKLQDESAKPYALIMAAEGDVSFLRFSDLEINHSRYVEGLRPYSSDAPIEAYVYSSQGVYRPGDVVNLAATIRTAAHVAAKAIAIKWRLTNPQGKVLKLQTGTTDDHGMVEFRFASADFASTGKYGIEVLSGDQVIGAHSFLIEEVVPERVSIQLTDRSAAGSKQLEIEAQANYLFGPPVADGKVNSTCRIKSLPHAIAGHPGFVTGIIPKKHREEAAILIAEADASLDAKGYGRFSCDYQAALRANNGPAKVELSLAVSEAGSGRKTRRTFSKPVASSDAFVGLKILSRPGDKQISFEARLFDVEGRQASGDGKVKVSLYRLESNWLYAYNEEVGYHTWISEDILIPEAKSEELAFESGKLSHQLQPSRDWGRYLVQVEDRNRNSIAQSQFAIGYDWWSGSPSDGSLPAPRSPDEFMIFAPSKPIAAGETFSVEFEAPFAGWVLFTAETSALHSAKWQQVERGKGSIELSAAKDVPNIYVSAILLKNPMEGEMYVPARAWGAASIKLDASASLLKVDIKTPTEMRSNRKLPIEVQITPAEEASVTLAIVDEGILQLTQFTSPDPNQYFAADRQLAVRTFETVGWTFNRKLKSGAPGGDDLAGANGVGRTIPVKMISLWPGIQKTDRNGRLKVEVDVPVFQGKLRVMALASSRKRTGASDSATIVADPLAMQPSLPRFLSHEDEFEIPVQIINATDKGLDLKLEASVNDTVAIDQTSQSMTIPKQSPAVLKFKAKVNAFEGNADFEFKVSSGEFSTVEKVSVPIIPATPELHFSKQYRLTEDFDISQMVPTAVRPGRLIANLSVANMPYLAGMTRVSELARYPYGCIEQTTSATFPLLAMQELAPWLKTLDAQLESIQEFAQAGISRVLSMQTGSGGFAYWPGDTQADFWGSIYATHMLLTAKNFGFSVPDDTITAATAYLVDQLRNNEIDASYVASNYRQRVYRDSEPYAQYVLALAGKPQAGRLRDLTTKPADFWQEQSDENRFLVAAALQKIGESKLATQALEQWAQTKPVALNKRRAVLTYWSKRRADGMRLAISEELWPGAAATEPLATQVALELASAPHLSTQELAWGIVGLAKRAQSFKSTDVQAVQLAANGKAMAAEFSQPNLVSWDLTGLNIPQTRFQIKDSDGKAGNALVVMSGHGFAKDFNLINAQNSDFSIARQYLNLAGEPIKLDQLKQGDLVVVELQIKSRRSGRTPNVAIVDRLPAGIEIENPRLGQGLSLDWMADDQQRLQPSYFDIRDDRIHLFADLEQPEYRYHYVARAITAGKFMMPPAKIEAMYEPEQFAYSDYGKVNIIL